MTQPSLPYPEPDRTRTAGHSGTDTSRERAIRERDDGVTGKRQQAALGYIGHTGTRGVTWKELGEALLLHHGQASGVLSVLHKDKRIARLTEWRQRCRVYVLPEHIDGRDTDEQGRHKSCPWCGGDL